MPPVLRQSAGQTGPDQGGIDDLGILGGIQPESVPAGDRLARGGDPETEPGAAEKKLSGDLRPGAGKTIQPTGVRGEHLETGLRRGVRPIRPGVVCFVVICPFARHPVRVGLGGRFRPELCRSCGIRLSGLEGARARQREIPLDRNGPARVPTFVISLILHKIDAGRLIRGGRSFGRPPASGPSPLGHGLGPKVVKKDVVVIRRRDVIEREQIGRKVVGGLELVCVGGLDLAGIGGRLARA
jgi:hypothetical protein